MPDTIEANTVNLIVGSTAEGRLSSQNIDYQLMEMAASKAYNDYANHSKSAFVSMVSHELRTPLTSILGFSELANDVCMANPQLTPKISTYVTYIHEAAVHLTKLINRILDLSKIEAGRLDVTRQWLSVEDCVRGTLWMMGDQAATAGVSLEMTIAPSAETVWADDLMLTEMLLNLLSNALKFTPSGGRVSVGATHTESGGITLTVTDTGCGIPADKLSAVFAPYEQIDNHYRRSLPGTGLGLSLVRAMMHLHGGHITLASLPGRGTVVTLHFPPPASLVH